MPQDFPAADDLVATAVQHLAGKAAHAMGGPKVVEAQTVARLLRTTAGLPVIRSVALPMGALYLSERVRSSLRGFAAFEALIAANLLMIAKREYELGERIRAEDRTALGELLDRTGTYEQLDAALVERLHDPAPLTGEEWSRMLAFLRASAVRHLRIANPDYAHPEVRNGG
ncbi:DUF6285 domain-containing protein [Nocardia sp. CDC160]|uniref:DUF6285 domain-containing protein n=1 Tax=Nocardia sp. CDC160 TaxID=3112166 RepID=UPI002DBB52F2|nr:DUF6285 domain-containing protein [Nocardia sp. CDC160]MEC3915632.1 DUF6285 domain-containing protein [Nocardia sp. CDC160]